MIETNRLFLREVNIDDASAIFNNWASDKEVTKYLTWNYHKNIETTKEILNIWVNEYKIKKVFRYGIVLKQTNELIGMIDVPGYDDGNPHIGYCLSRKYWNNGYMSEALGKFIEILFNNGFKKLLIEACEDNIASNKVIQKCGFKFIKKEEQYFKLKDKKMIINMYELNK